MLKNGWLPFLLVRRTFETDTAGSEEYSPLNTMQQGVAKFVGICYHMDLAEVSTKKDYRRDYPLLIMLRTH